MKIMERSEQMKTEELSQMKGCEGGSGEEGSKQEGNH